MTWARLALATLLGLVSLAKMLGGHSDSYSLSPAVFYAAAAVEAVVAILLVFDYRTTFAATAVIALAVGGVALSLLRKQPCGCLGSFFLGSWRTHMFVSGALGALAALVVTRKKASRS